MISTAVSIQRKPRSPGTNSRGFSLVELMIAMLLGLLVVGALGQIYVGGRDVNRIIDNAATLNENGRFAMEFFARDIRLAGYFACGGPKSQMASVLNDEGFWTALEGITGFDGGTDVIDAEALPAAFNAFPDRLDGTDVFVTRYADVRHGITLPPGGMKVGTKSFVFDTSHPFAKGDVIVLNDASCTQAALFQATNASDAGGIFSITFDDTDISVTPGNCTSKLAGDFSCADSDREYAERYPDDGFASAMLTPFTARAFFLANLPADDCEPTVGDCAALANCPTLYLAGTDTSGAVPVLRDVTDLEVTYGIDDDIDPLQPGSGDASADRYLDADDVRAEDLWGRVISLRINLTLTNADCKDVDFTTTAALRNSASGSMLLY